MSSRPRGALHVRSPSFHILTFYRGEITRRVLFSRESANSLSGDWTRRTHRLPSSKYFLLLSCHSFIERCKSPVSRRARFHLWLDRIKQLPVACIFHKVPDGSVHKDKETFCCTGKTASLPFYMMTQNQKRDAAGTNRKSLGSGHPRFLLGKAISQTVRH